MDIKRRAKEKRIKIFGVLLGICVTVASMFCFFFIEIPYEEAQKIDEEVGLQRTIPFNVILLIVGIVAFIIIWVSIKLHKRRKEKKHEQNK